MAIKVLFIVNGCLFGVVFVISSNIV